MYTQNIFGSGQLFDEKFFDGKRCPDCGSWSGRDF